MNEQICTRCKKSRDLSLFQGESNKTYTRCKLCRDHGKLYYQQNKNKENCAPDHIEVCSSKEMSTELKKLIYSVGQSEYIENLEHGIAFIKTITIEDFDGSAKEIANNIRDIICESDGYYYM
jgi:hypothetical protein